MANTDQVTAVVFDGSQTDADALVQNKKRVRLWQNGVEQTAVATSGTVGTALGALNVGAIGRTTAGTVPASMRAYGFTPFARALSVPELFEYDAALRQALAFY